MRFDGTQHHGQSGLPEIAEASSCLVHVFRNSSSLTVTTYLIPGAEIMVQCQACSLILVIADCSTFTMRKVIQSLMPRPSPAGLGHSAELSVQCFESELILYRARGEGK